VLTSFGCLDTNPQAGETMLPSELGNGPAAVAVNLRVSRSFGIGPKVQSPGGPTQGGRGGGPGGGGPGGFGAADSAALAAEAAVAVVVEVVAACSAAGAAAEECRTPDTNTP